MFLQYRWLQLWIAQRHVIMNHKRYVRPNSGQNFGLLWGYRTVTKTFCFNIVGWHPLCKFPVRYFVFFFIFPQVSHGTSLRHTPLSNVDRFEWPRLLWSVIMPQQTKNRCFVCCQCYCLILQSQYTRGIPSHTSPILTMPDITLCIKSPELILIDCLKSFPGTLMHKSGGKILN